MENNSKFKKEDQSTLLPIHSRKYMSSPTRSNWLSCHYITTFIHINLSDFCLSLSLVLSPFFSRVDRAQLTQVHFACCFFLWKTWRSHASYGCKQVVNRRVFGFAVKDEKQTRVRVTSVYFLKKFWHNNYSNFKKKFDVVLFMFRSNNNACSVKCSKLIRKIVRTRCEWNGR